MINKQHFDIILKYVNLLCPNIRKPKFDSQYYLTQILDMINDFVTWRSLKKSANYVNKSSYHYKTIAKKHILWSKKGVYRLAYEEIIENKHNNIVNEDDKKMDLFIDSTMIFNKGGVECIGYGGETKKKKFTKLTAVCNKNGNNIQILPNNTIQKLIINPIKIDVFNINEDIGIKKYELPNSDIIKFDINEDINEDINIKKLIKGNKYNKINIINTLEHDIKGVLPILNKIKHENVDVNLIGDKGYIMNNTDKKVLKELKVTIITPKRKNQKGKNTESEKNKLKKRYKVENMFQKNKTYNRVLIRRDKLIATYMGFVYLSCIHVS